MGQISIDAFVEAFAASLIQKGQRVIRLNEQETRNNLFQIYVLLDRELQQLERSESNKERRRLLISARELFRPSPIGAFDQFESLMREKQIYLTEHPNPYYQDIVLKTPAPAADAVIKSLPELMANVVSRVTDTYLDRVHANA